MSKNRTWGFLNNPFDAATDGSYRAMRKIGKYTLDAIKGMITTGPSIMTTTTTTPSDNEFFTPLRDKLQPLVNDFEEKYAKWLNQLGQRKGQTTQLADKLAMLRGVKIEDWDLIIQGVYRKGTPGYDRLLPNRRGPFQTGRQEDRLAALQAFNMAVDADTALPPAIKSDVNTFMQELEAEIENQNEEKSGANNASDAVEASRQALCVGLYGVMGALMTRYEATPVMVGNFFNQEMIRNHQQSTFRMSLKEEETNRIVEHTFDAEDDVRLVNDGETPLRFFLAANEGDGIGTQFVQMAANTKKTVDVTELGPVTNRFLKVKNMSAEGKGHCVVVMI